MDTITYQIEKNLYINLTNRCSNRCTFCVREGKETYEGYPLWLREGEPTADKIIGEIGDPKQYEEIVFCGFGEPTYRLADMVAVSEAVHRLGGKTRLNTNGHGSVINGFDIAPVLKGNLDFVNISLNAPDEELYCSLCRPRIPHAFEAVLDFARSLRREGVPCHFSVVDCIGRENVARCRILADGVGIPLKVRAMIE